MANPRLIGHVLAQCLTERPCQIDAALTPGLSSFVNNSVKLLKRHALTRESVVRVASCGVCTCGHVGGHGGYLGGGVWGSHGHGVWGAYGVWGSQMAVNVAKWLQMWPNRRQIG